MKPSHRHLLAQKTLLVGFAAVALTGCRPELPFFNFSEDQAAAPADPAASPAPAASPSPAQASPGQASPAAAQVIRCETANYYADVAFEGGQPLMTFVRKPETASLSKIPTTRTDNPDGSVTFGAAGSEVTFYARIFPNAACFLQTVASNGAVGLEESGRVR